jgi:hypothetical protein
MSPLLPTRRVPPARGPPTDWGELVQLHDDWAIFQASADELPGGFPAGPHEITTIAKRLQSIPS